MFSLHRTIVLLVLLFSIAPHIYAVDYKGTVSISKKGKPVSQGEYADTVIYFVPKQTVETEPLNTEPKEMKMEKKKYSPRVLPIAVGTEVSFPNFDPILHNAFSTSTNNNFDLGLYSGGETDSHTFDKAGLVRVYCNVHHAMVAYILVFDSPYFTTPSSNGEFVLNDLPEIPGQLFIWHPRAKLIKEKIDLSQTIEQKKFNVDLTKRKIPKHSNKDGKSYRKARKKSY